MELLVQGQGRSRNCVIIVDVEGIDRAQGKGLIVADGVDVIGGDQQAIIEFVVPGHDGGQEFGDGALAGGVGGHPGDLLVGLDGDSAMLAAADHQERDRHEGDDGEQDQRNDERDAAFRGTRGNGRGASDA